MSKQILRVIGSLMAIVGIAIIGFALYSYIAQQQLEAKLEAEVPGQAANIITTTPVVMQASLNLSENGKPGAAPTINVALMSPSVTPMPIGATPVQPDATTAAGLASSLSMLAQTANSALPSQTAIALSALGSPTATAVPTQTTSYTSTRAKPTPTIILAGVHVPTPVGGAPTVIAADSKPQGAERGTGSPATRLIIPKLNLNLSVISADYITYQLNGQFLSDWNVPFGAAGHLSSSAQPGEIGNAILSGHHNLTAPNTFGLGAFAGMWNLVPSDEIRVQTADGKTQLWRVTDSFPVKEGGEPIEVRIEHAQEIMADGPTPELTLLTCWNGKSNPLSGNTYRWVIHAELVGVN